MTDRPATAGEESPHSRAAEANSFDDTMFLGGTPAADGTDADSPAPDQPGQASRRPRRALGRLRLPLAERTRALSQRAGARVVGTLAHPLVVGAEHVDDGAAIVAVNHPGRSDRALLQAALTDGGARPRSVFVTGLEDADELTEARRRLRGGSVVVVFVEGDRSPDGALHRARDEFGELITAADVPVVPAALRPPVDRRGWLAASGAAGASVEFGAAIDIDRHRERPGDPLARQAASDAVLHAITLLAGSEYVDSDVAQRRAELRRQAAEERAARAEEARRRRAEAERAREEAERRAVEDARWMAEELAAAERAAREHAARAAAEDAARREALLQQRRAGRPADPGHWTPPTA